MTNIDFYILQNKELAARSQFLCRLCKKARGQGHQIYIHCDDEQQAKQLDELLWTFEENSFLPHKAVADITGASPIEIGFGNISAEHHGDLLINFSSSRADFFAQFDRLAEIVVQEEKLLQASRTNYRFYKQRNYPIRNHQIAA
jgi:DNA polymerase-3 subunit chi